MIRSKKTTPTPADVAARRAARQATLQAREAYRAELLASPPGPKLTESQAARWAAEDARAAAAAERRQQKQAEQLAAEEQATARRTRRNRRKARPLTIYTAEVRRLTELQPLHQVPGIELRGPDWNLDHVVSCRAAWLAGWPPEQCAAVENLQILPFADNFRKGNNCYSSLASRQLPRAALAA